MSKNTLLIVTAGQTDVYLVVEENGQRIKQQFSKDDCARLHREIEKRDPEQWSLVDALGGRAGWATALPEGKFCLATPKLDAALQYCENNGCQVTSALILDTSRKDGGKGEPHYAGEILKRRLLEACAQVQVTVAHYLTEGRLEGSPDSPDALIRRDVVAALDQAVRTAIETSESDVIVVSSTGGFDRISRIVDDMARMFADRKTVFALEVPEGGGRDKAIRKYEGPDPSEQYRLRRLALDLLEGGDLFSPWGIVKHLVKDVREEAYPEWIAALHGVYLFAAGLPVKRFRVQFRFLSIARAPSTALRVEFALRRGDVPGATLGTIAFGEAALRQLLAREYCDGRVRENGKESYRAKSTLTPEQSAKIQKLTSNNSGDGPFDILQDGWLEIRRDELALADELFPGTALVRYLKVTSDPRSSSCKDIRQLRHDVAHGEPNRQLMKTVWDKMKEAVLWQESDPKFLGTNLASELLMQLGTLQATNLAQQFLDEVRQHVLA